ncbi:hypothetical protein QCE63_34215 [Caballeronia sp. LZ065]|uniref:hypothetical protein n=1 Tax=Caballeronia sp. LZ065 TaxID=3038571 RepID=UPI002863C76D|nr:hypothetical protein [Caballeronia sp. LZ065]MDR5784471.1 hypothetical protein [Caballeronia sp. LZ065]
MNIYDDDQHVRRVSAEIAVLAERIRRQLGDVEVMKLDSREREIALRRLFVLREYHYVLVEDKAMMLRRMALGAVQLQRSSTSGSLNGDAD